LRIIILDNNLTSRSATIAVEIAPYQDHFVVFQFGITLVVTEIIDSVGFGGVSIGKIVETEALFLKVVFHCCGFFSRIQSGKDHVILFQDAVDAPDHIVRFTELTVVVGAATLVVAEFLVGPSSEWFAAIEALSLFVHFLRSG
jgi:hypothetical protein